MMEYIVISSSSLEELVKEVNNLMKEDEGWLPTGAMTTVPGSFGTGIDYLQPMICWGKRKEECFFTD